MAEQFGDVPVLAAEAEAGQGAGVGVLTQPEGLLVQDAQLLPQAVEGPGAHALINGPPRVDAHGLAVLEAASVFSWDGGVAPLAQVEEAGQLASHLLAQGVEQGGLIDQAEVAHDLAVALP